MFIVCVCDLDSISFPSADGTAREISSVLLGSHPLHGQSRLEKK